MIKGTESLLKRLDKLSTAITDGVPKVVTAVCEQRAATAQEEYANAGNKDKKRKSGENGPVKVTSTRADSTWSIVASGEALLFLEYGTGIIYPRTNPDDPYTAGSWSIEHEQYLTDSEKLAKYKGGWPLGNGVITYGNPSYNVMYDTKKWLREHIVEEMDVPVARALK